MGCCTGGRHAETNKLTSRCAKKQDKGKNNFQEKGRWEILEINDKQSQRHHRQEITCDMGQCDWGWHEPGGYCGRGRQFSSPLRGWWGWHSHDMSRYHALFVVPCARNSWHFDTWRTSSGGFDHLWDAHWLMSSWSLWQRGSVVRETHPTSCNQLIAVEMMAMCFGQSKSMWAIWTRGHILQLCYGRQFTFLFHRSPHWSPFIHG